MKKIKLGFSTCPNDTFMFDALVNGRIDTGGLEFEIYMGDILNLNQKALAGELDMVKISYNTFGQVFDQYKLLRAGSALGNNCGPLLIAKESIDPKEIAKKNLKVAIPGKNTTANLLLTYFDSGIHNREEMLFHEVMPAVLEGKADAGLIIHENRFTYQDLGLVSLQDLGEYWEQKTGLAIPLGAIVANRSLGNDLISKLEALMRNSVEYAFQNPEDSMPFVKGLAQEMKEEVMKAHIGLYVNQFSIDLGKEGILAVEKVLETGETMGLFNAGTLQKFRIEHEIEGWVA